LGGVNIMNRKNSWGSLCHFVISEANLVLSAVFMC